MFTIYNDPLSTLYQTSPGFLLDDGNPLKTLSVKELLLVTSVFHLFGELSAFFIKFEIVVCKVFRFGRV